MSNAKRHHYVPQFYLRRFADESGRLRVYRTHSQLPPIMTTVKDAAVRTGFYKLDLTGPGDPMQLESELAKIEDESARVIQRVSSARSWPPSQSDRDVLATYLGLQLMRTPEKRREHEEMTDTIEKVFYENMTVEHARAQLIKTGEDPTEEKVALIMNVSQHPDQYRFVLHPNEFLRSMVTVGLEAARVLAGRSWWLGTSPGPAFATGDHVPVLFTRPEMREPFKGIGLQGAEEIHFPLDRHHILLMFPTGMPEKAFVLDRENVTFTNSLMASSSHRFVFRHPDDPPIDYMIPKEPKPLMEINQKPVYEVDARTKIQLAPIFSPFFVKSGPPEADEMTSETPEA